MSQPIGKMPTYVGVYLADLMTTVAAGILVVGWTVSLSISQIIHRRNAYVPPIETKTRW